MAAFYSRSARAANWQEKGRSRATNHTAANLRDYPADRELWAMLDAAQATRSGD
ncbi:MAG: hypothetical protein V9H69_22305 [Anaerolineae bacterium]